MTAKGDKLIDTMIKAEKRLDDDFKRRAEPIFALLDPFEIDETYPAFEAAFLQLIDESSEKFFNLNKGFLRAYVLTEFKQTAGAATDVYQSLSKTDRERFASSLSVVTRASIKGHTAQGHSILKAYDDAKTRALGVGRRSSREAAREHLERVSMSTTGIRGYKRVLTGNESCSFCALLADRGAVYTADTVNFAAHPDCDCLGVPTVSGPPASTAQKTVSAPRDSKMFDKEKAAAAVKEWERKRDAGEIEIVKPPPRIYV